MGYILQCWSILLGDESCCRSCKDAVDTSRRVINSKGKVIVYFECRIISDVEIDVDLGLLVITNLFSRQRSHRHKDV
jgi:hypothetical protein